MNTFAKYCNFHIRYINYIVVLYFLNGHISEALVQICSHLFFGTGQEVSTPCRSHTLTSFIIVCQGYFSLKCQRSPYQTSNLLFSCCFSLENLFLQQLSHPVSSESELALTEGVSECFAGLSSLSKETPCSLSEAHIGRTPLICPDELCDSLKEKGGLFYGI